MPDAAVCAQTAADITPPTLAPAARPLTGAVVFSGDTGLGAPEGADRLTVTIRSVTLEDGFAEMAAANRALEERLTGRTIRVSEIFEAAQNLEAAYAEAGFVLARVVLPAQELRDGGSLRLVVVDGFVEAVEADSVPDPVRGRIAQVTTPLEGQRSLRLREIERALLIAGDTYGLALDSALARGAGPGATRLVLGGDFRPMTGFVGFDTGYASDLGGYSLDAGLELNGMLGWTETLYFRISGNPGSAGVSEGLFSRTPRMRTLAAGIIAPIGTDGLTWNLEVTESRTTPRAAGVQTTSKFERAAFRLSYPLVRSREFNVTLRASLDLQQDKQDAIAPDGSRLPFYQDRLRVLRLGASLSRIAPEGGSYLLDGTASFGLDAFGARSGTVALPLSRAGARPDFAKLDFSGRLVRPVGERLVFTLSGKAQTAFGRPLPKSEQIGLASASDLSGFATGSLTGDSGLAVRGELRAPFQPEATQALITPYAFAATGILWLHQPTALEQGRRRMSSVGLGVEVLPLLNSRFASASLRLEAARGIQHGGGPDDSRVSLVGTFRF
jgi:hemolysin activation/secretion protein